MDGEIGLPILKGLQCEKIYKKKSIKSEFLCSLFCERRGRTGEELKSLRVHSKGDIQVQGMFSSIFFSSFFFLSSFLFYFSRKHPRRSELKLKFSKVKKPELKLGHFSSIAKLLLALRVVQKQFNDGKKTQDDAWVQVFSPSAPTFSAQIWLVWAKKTQAIARPFFFFFLEKMLRAPRRSEHEFNFFGQKKAELELGYAKFVWSSLSLLIFFPSSNNYWCQKLLNNGKKISSCNSGF